MGPAHVPYREDRMVWAFDRVHGGLVRIGIGHADVLRSRAQAGELVCPVADCHTPTLTTRRDYTTGSGTFVPDGFRHRSAPNSAHGPESVAHVTGKLIVVRSLERTGWTEVHAERHDTQAGRTPDVTAVRGGRRLAVEVQFARITTQEWAARTEALAASGFEVLWLWGSRTAQCTERRLWAPQAQMLRSGMPLTWLCPDEEKIGVAAAARRARPRHREPDTDVLVLPEPRDRTVWPLWVHTSGVRMQPGGMSHPSLDVLARRTAWFRRVRLAQLQGCLEHLNWRRNAGRPAERAALAKAAAAPGARRRTALSGPGVAVFRIPPSEPATTGPLAVSRADLRLLAEVELDAVVRAEDPCDALVYQPVVTWHAAVVLRLLRRPVGSRVNVNRIGEFVARHTIGERGRGAGAVRGQLRRLERTGWVRVDRGEVCVLRSLPSDVPEPSEKTLPSVDQLPLFGP